jgi:Domain of unknown function (DUF5615)
VKLLFDENLSPRLVGALASLYQDSQHVDSIGLHGQFVARFKRNGANQVVLQLNGNYKGGAIHILMSPLKFVHRLAALGPRTRLYPIHNSALSFSLR